MCDIARSPLQECVDNAPGNISPKLRQKGDHSISGLDFPCQTIDHSQEEIWSFMERSLRPLPWNRPVEKTSIISPDADLSKVTKKIAFVLYQLSLSSRFDLSKGKIKCVSIENIHFVIRFFRGKDCSVVVEVRRMSGCSLIFYNKYYSAINAAVSGVVRLPSKAKNFPCNVSNTSKDDSDQQASLYRIEEMIYDNYWDTKVLAMQLLTFLTGERSGYQNTKFYGEQLLRGEKTGIFNFITSLIFESRLLGEQCDDYESLELLRGMAFEILFNVLEFSARQNQLFEYIQNNKGWYENLLVAIVKEIYMPHINPHNAYRAVRCMNIIFATSEELRIKGKELDACSYLLLANCFSSSRHLLLEKETNQAISILET
uniref:Uncharacterized protein n=1 Tax=Corethron hystrix TaxID=216773 RepID=A0A7S1B8K2_9STRA|mmetsp:Transcript_15550/g.34962  ORF Transcript_15550/g.34962 Transcript_15550/m.34962 type:complete len:372 (+) Transcript_15550:67-1182(+)